MTPMPDNTDTVRFEAVFDQGHLLKGRGRTELPPYTSALDVAAQMWGLQAFVYLVLDDDDELAKYQNVEIHRLSMQSPLEVAFSVVGATPVVSFGILRLVRTAAAALKEWSDARVHVEANEARIEALRILRANMKRGDVSVEESARRDELEENLFTAADALVSLKSFEQVPSGL